MVINMLRSIKLVVNYKGGLLILCFLYKDKKILKTTVVIENFVI